ncbi:hypothetical protein ACIBBG_33110 [Micromonospora chersina]|uniref:hypothetical protein n=1 Tax=Micromonospora chersina TaxID=47854 RepID=UPI00379CFEB5
MNKAAEYPLAGFERRLLGELAQIDAQRTAAAPTTGARTAVTAIPSPARRHRMRPALIGTSLAAILAASALYLGTPSATTTPPHGGGASKAIAAAPAEVSVRPVAFAVTKNNDGTVTFTAHDLVDTDAATKALNDAGIAGRVLNAQKQSCPGPANGSNGRNGALYLAARGKDTNTVTISSSGVPTGGGALIVVNPKILDPHTKKSLHIWLITLVYDHTKDIPTCVDLGGLTR